MTEITLLETIKCKDGKLYNLDFHQQRFERARTELGFDKKIFLKDEILVPEPYQKGVFRCRVLYAGEIEKIEFLPHQTKTISSLKLVYDDAVDYHLKYSNRDYLNELYKRRGKYDDILIVKNNCITDSWTANPIFYDGIKWITPDTPLLPGTQRARLLSEGKVQLGHITPGDLKKYQMLGLINALQDLNDMPIVKIENIGI